MKRLASRAASSSARPRAKQAASAAAVMHPVPCVWRVAMRGARSSCIVVPSSSTSTASAPSRWPPFTSAAPAPAATRRRAASCMSASDWMRIPSRTSASGTFGVTTVASGMSSPITAARASSSSKRAPLCASITGSTTNGARRCARTAAATATTISRVASIPVFAASTPMSPTTASICWRTKAPLIGTMALTPRVFCAVSAVTAVMP
jgi:hypothetical protein